MSSPSQDRMYVYEALAERVTYHPLTGLIYWKKNPTGPKKWNCLSPAGGDNGKGYMQMGIKLNNKKFNVKQHNLAWFIAHGELAKDGFSIDHKNDRKADNRLENLRILSHCGQSIARAKGSELPPWVYLNKARNKFQARAKVDGKSKTIGYFDDPWKGHVTAADFAIENELIDPAEYAMLIAEWHEFRGGANNV